MFKRSTAWSDEPRFKHTQHMVEVCPPELVPTVYQNMASGGLGINWPDVCHCVVNGGPTFEVHEVKDNCQLATGEGDECQCQEVEGSASRWLTGGMEPSHHVAGCPFDVCPLGQCHPMCSQVTHDGQENWCHCPCHG